jgi:hypothetical protein
MVLAALQQRAIDRPQANVFVDHHTCSDIHRFASRGFTLNGWGGQGARTGRVRKWPVRIILLHNVGKCRVA